MLDSIRQWALGTGMWGLGAIAFLDSSFLSLPQVTDALVLLLSTRHPDSMAAYAGLATIGSVAGSLALFVVSRTGGEVFLRRRFGARHVDRALRVYGRWGSGAIALAALAPPPVPFKLMTVLAGASGMHPAAFGGAVLLGRGVRYFGEGALAARFGDQAGAVVRAHWQPALLLVLLVLTAAIAWMAYRRTASDPVDEGVAADG
jgi:membrane protein YqaA with SNARE-associated domain